MLKNWFQFSERQSWHFFHTNRIVIIWRVQFQHSFRILSLSLRWLRSNGCKAQPLIKYLKLKRLLWWNGNTWVEFSSHWSLSQNCERGVQLVGFFSCTFHCDKGEYLFLETEKEPIETRHKKALKYFKAISMFFFILQLSQTNVDWLIITEFNFQPLQYLSTLCLLSTVKPRDSLPDCCF